MTRAERRAQGKALRIQVPRSIHGTWQPAPQRPDPIAVLKASDRGRLTTLLPIRYGRMLASPFAFLRGAAAVMASDLGATPRMGLHVQACGDAHIGNFGGFATPERRLVFDINDFDETLPAPWEWDVKRLAASVVVASRTNGLPRAAQRAAAFAAVRGYRTHMAALARLSHLQAFYSSIEVRSLVRRFGPGIDRRGRKQLKKAAVGDDLEVGKLVAIDQDRPLIRDAPPLVYHPSALAEHRLEKLLHSAIRRYVETLPHERAELVSQYQVDDLAMKVVGVGSVGTRCAVLLLSAGADDLLILQVKEARASVLEPFAGASRFANHGERVVVGQHLMQSASDIFVGWTSGPFGRDYYIRQLRDGKIKATIDRFGATRMIDYAGACGTALAGGHGRSGDAPQIAGYMGTSDLFDTSIVRFAERYADQTEKDYALLRAAVKRGRLPADTARR